jgi:hypothetical protein
MTLDGVEQLRVLHGFRPAQYSSAITGVVGAIKCNHKLSFLYTLNAGTLTSLGHWVSLLRRAGESTADCRLSREQFANFMYQLARGHFPLTAEKPFPRGIDLLL